MVETCGNCIYSDLETLEEPCKSCDESRNNWERIITTEETEHCKKIDEKIKEISNEIWVEQKSSYKAGVIKGLNMAKELIHIEQKEPCMYCKNFNVNILTPSGKYIRRANFCNNCGRDLRDGK